MIKSKQFVHLVLIYDVRIIFFPEVFACAFKKGQCGTCIVFKRSFHNCYQLFLFSRLKVSEAIHSLVVILRRHRGGRTHRKRDIRPLSLARMFETTLEKVWTILDEGWYKQNIAESAYQLWRSSVTSALCIVDCVRGHALHMSAFVLCTALG